MSTRIEAFIPDTDAEYQYVKGDYLSDSAKIEMTYWITETMKASSNQMTGGDYEDPEDVIEQLEETGRRLFTKRVDGLRKWNSEGRYWDDFVPVYELTKRELFILDSLKNQ